MRLDVRQNNHPCSCQQHVPELNARGVALQSEAPPVVSALRQSFPESRERPGVFIAEGPGFSTRVREVIAGFSAMERANTRAVVIGEDGRFDAWASAPIERILDRINTAWLPGLLNNEQLTFHLQPIVGSLGMEIHGFEALVRGAGEHKNKSPGDIIHAAKSHEALLKFDQIARRRAIEIGAPKLLAGERLFINFLPMTVYDPSVCLRTTIKAAQDAGVDFSRLVFEVVESEEYPDIDHLRRILDVYREAGCGVALDDLGSGNTAINYIDLLQPDYIKLDKHIVVSAVENEQYGLLLGLVSYAKQRNITVIAEGVETEQQLAVMQEFGVDLIQGWLIAKPAAEPVREFAVKGRLRAA
ncbi:MAG: EAL domain-containing protein [Phycisphaerales bacterium]|nr:EAL domain-containing protein [Planctomycetota bacterium]MCH8507912.1 EAL domain-containing protein [Phycisphaerales bacterium]